MSTSVKTDLAERKSPAAAIFISYRRHDSQGFAGRLADDLIEHFGDEQIFRDDEIVAGSDFSEVLDAVLSGCQVVLVVIGRRWLDARNAQGSRRLDDPDDWVRQEIETALARNVRLIPVLVGDAEMPKPSELPPSLSRLAYTQAFELSDHRWDADVARLLILLRKSCPELKPPARAKPGKALQNVPTSPRPRSPAPVAAPRWRQLLQTVFKSRSRRAYRRPLGNRLASLLFKGLKQLVAIGIVLLLAYFVLENYADPATKKFVTDFFDFVRQLATRVLSEVF